MEKLSDSGGHLRLDPELTSPAAERLMGRSVTSAPPITAYAGVHVTMESANHVKAMGLGAGRSVFARVAGVRPP